MSVTFHILKDHGLVYVRYDGVVNAADTMQAFAAYAQHPDCRPGQKQLVDLSRATEVEFDFVDLMQMQAKKADVFMAEGAQTLITYVAPTRLGRDVVASILKSWESFSTIVPICVETLSDACDVLGLPEPDLTNALKAA
ncbi:hypothetical protein [Shimia sp. SDUM112013]|uniref:hypothetical protein n=1 Tax=Shimia sp. SDUM112013 TaxID=3136160 RepID=UPI0032EDC6B0